METGQLVQLYDENEEVTVEMLAQNFHLEVEAVKMALAASSKRFRKELKKDDEVFNDEEYNVAKSAMVNLVRYSEVDAVKFRAANFIINEKLGRNKLQNARNLQGMGNINIVNLHISQARKALEQSKKQNIVIDVESAKQLREEAA